MNREFTLSIIIPNYNKEKYISQCLESIVGQTYLPNEIIVVDDCSTDNSREVIQEYERKYNIVKGVYLDTNAGVSHARNFGLALATSEYVSFTDSDDFYFSKDKLRNEMLLIKKYAECGIDIVSYSALVRVREDGVPIKLPKLNKSNFANGDILVDLIARVKVHTIPRDYCVKKQVIESVGAYSFYKNFYEDLDLLMRLAQEVPFYCTNQYGMAYRMTDGGLSKRKHQEHIYTVNEITGKYYKELKLKKRIIVILKKYIWKIMWKLKRYSK